jgi:oligoribonuclease NrnB/cAMP/cGMP phosphodiesterase (DHH superfamily)
MSILVLTHNDLDAAGCSILLKERYKGEKIEIQFHNYDSIDAAVQRYLKEGSSNQRQLILADISPKAETCEQLNSAVKEYRSVISLYDHHKTKAWLTKYPWAKFDASMCATKILFDNILVTDPNLKIENYRYAQLKNLSLAINAWDIWQLDSPNRARGVSLNTLLTFFGIHTFSNMLFEHIPLLNQLTINKNNHVDRVIREQLTVANVYIDGQGNTFKVLFSSDFISEVGNTALLHPDGEDLKYVVIVGERGESCSLRSRTGEVDVGNIAKQLNGGGHTNAAGFPIDGKQMLERIVFEKLNKLN